MAQADLRRVSVVHLDTVALRSMVSVNMHRPEKPVIITTMRQKHHTIFAHTTCGGSGPSAASSFLKSWPITAIMALKLALTKKRICSAALASLSVAPDQGFKE